MRNKSTKYILASLTSALAAVLVSASLRNAHSMSALYSYILMSFALLGLAAVLAAMGLIELSEEVKKPRYGKIDRRHARCEAPEYRQNRRGA